MANISINNFIYDYLPSYYVNDTRVTKVQRAYGTQTISRANFRNNIYTANFTLENKDYYFYTSANPNSTSLVPIVDIVVEDNDNGHSQINYLYSIGYQCYMRFDYFTLNPVTNINEANSTTIYFTDDMVSGDVVTIDLTSLPNQPYSVSFGVVITERAKAEYMDSFINFYYDEAFQNGYDAGVSETNPMQGGINLMTTYWQGMTSLMDHQIMPGLTIGGFVSIPLIITAIIVIFKVVK